MSSGSQQQLHGQLKKHLRPPPPGSWDEGKGVKDWDPGKSLTDVSPYVENTGRDISID